MRTEQATGEPRGAYTGWWAAGFVLLAVFLGAGALWFMFHP